ncbi:hypothetical protein [Cyprinid herpesvirus 2]|nr:hypothetical protein [Cyprinid herpesvirus 2]
MSRVPQQRQAHALPDGLQVTGSPHLHVRRFRRPGAGLRRVRPSDRVHHDRIAVLAELEHDRDQPIESRGDGPRRHTDSGHQHSRVQDDDLGHALFQSDLPRLVLPHGSVEETDHAGDEGRDSPGAQILDAQGTAREPEGLLQAGLPQPAALRPGEGGSQRSRQLADPGRPDERSFAAGAGHAQRDQEEHALHQAVHAPERPESMQLRRESRQQAGPQPGHAREHTPQRDFHAPEPLQVGFRRPGSRSVRQASVG